MNNNSQARKWFITINNPHNIDLIHSMIIKILMSFTLTYYCMSDEIGEKGTYHTHIFIMSDSPIRFSTIKNRFPTAHIEKAYGSAMSNKEYVLKGGKWEDTEKAETSVPGTFEEWGYLPTEKEEKAPLMAEVINDINSGLSTAEIIASNPKLAFKIKDIELLRQLLQSERYTRENRELEVTYLFGASGTGKTRGIYEQFPAQDICRITNYGGNKGVCFDAYHGQSVLVFEEFNSQIQIEEMLNYLDIYPLMLPARYNDRTACYTKVFITSNVPLDQQYKAVQEHKPETWRAFNRRIHHVIEYLPDGSTRTIK